MNAHDHTHRCLACPAARACRNTCGGPGEVVLDECADCTAKHPPSRRFCEGYLILTGAGLATARILAATKVWTRKITGDFEVQDVPHLREAERERLKNLGWTPDANGEARDWRWRNA